MATQTEREVETPPFMVLVAGVGFEPTTSGAGLKGGPAVALHCVRYPDAQLPRSLQPQLHRLFDILQSFLFASSTGVAALQALAANMILPRFRDTPG